MIKALDSKGNVIPYISRGPGGGLIVSDHVGKREHLLKIEKDRSNAERLHKIENELSELKEMMRELLKRN